METIEIIKVTDKEILELQKIAKQTFYESNVQSNSEDNIKSYLEKSFSINQIMEELNNINSEFYFTKFENQIIGYLKLNFEQLETELKNNKVLEIERIYVLKEFHGKKVGQILYNKAIEIAKYKNIDYVWLGVWEENLRAINFYKKNGFMEFDSRTFKLGNDQQTDIIMQLKLTN